MDILKKGGEKVREKDLFKGILGIGFIGIIINLCVYGGLIYFVFWCLKHFNIGG